MAYTLKSITDCPSSDRNCSELADYLEIQCLLNEEGSYSITAAASSMGIIEDDDSDNEEKIETLKSALNEVDERWKKTNQKYPFQTSQNSINDKHELSSTIREIYIFLLLATRLNMQVNKVQNGIDGTAIFEKLCAEVLRNYFGKNARAFVFGTGASSSNKFQEKIESFIKYIGEKCSFRWPIGSMHCEKDGGIDVVAFIPFSDGQQGKFIALGQCKTGTSWRIQLSNLKPQSFVDKYITPNFTFTPIAIFMVCESFYENWEEHQRNCSGLLFDRNRIMEYVPLEMDSELLNQIKEWNRNALFTIKSN